LAIEIRKNGWRFKMDKEQSSGKRFKFSIGYVIVLILLLTLLQQFVIGPMLSQSIELSYSDFKDALRRGQVISVRVSETKIIGMFEAEGQTEAVPFSTIRVDDGDLLSELEDQDVEIAGEVESHGGLWTVLSWIMPMALIFGAYYLIMKRSKGGSNIGNSIFSFGKSKARVIKGEQSGVTFKDVGGAGQAITELREVTEFLKNPARFQRLGGKMLKGVLLFGPPGTGKTLLARATAGEAGVPFFSLSAAEFIEMFVGVGAARVRDLFEQAKKQAPSIIFIDEIDAIGGQRGGVGIISRNEEREQTLNQLLAEMDGFQSTRGVIVMAATNRPEVLDPALLRPGRFDRQISVDLPDLVGREEILQIHTREVVLSEEVDEATIARITPGFSGADLANLVNEAALLASRRGKDKVEMVDFDEATERVLAGSERRSMAMNPHEKEIVAYHEAGHSLVASLLPNTDPVHKVSIVPRGRALGYTMQRPIEDRYLLSENELHARLAVLLGGRVAEALKFGEVSTGATDDLARATDLARRMVTEYGMSPTLGPVRLAAEPQLTYLNQHAGLDARVSPQTAAAVDAETWRIVEAAVSQTWQLLEDYQVALDRVAQRLCEQETIDAQELAAILESTEARFTQPAIPLGLRGSTTKQ
jgi:cell division protease FtsH